jgi:hypothetical protein
MPSKPQCRGSAPPMSRAARNGITRRPRRRQLKSLRRLPSPAWQFLQRTGLYLAIGALAVATTGIAWLYSPNVTIRPAAALNPVDANDAEFIVSNTSRVTVHNLLFQCEIIPESGARFTTSGNIVHLPSGRVVVQSIGTLLPNESITRSCRLGASTSPPPTVARSPASIVATAHYTWPLVKWTGSSTRRFSARQDQRGGIVLVPD